MSGRLAREARLILLAAGFLTRLPVPPDPAFTPQRMAWATRWFPLVGLGIGAVVALVFWAAALVLPAWVAAVLALAAGVRLTGALHEDGLADVADGLGGGQSREHALEIMRDSRIGSYGTVALVLVLLLKAGALAHLGGAAVAAMIAAHGLSRVFVVLTMLRLPYARPEGKAGFASAAEIGPGGLGIVLGTGALTALGLAVAAGPGAALSALAAAAAVTLWIGAMLRRRLGGYTGDGLGAVQQLTETAILLGVLAWV
ncbi:adenosylcobinamide-GDP ribazoletransferase [Rhodovulum strictum]|uniref:Adenosylcobinamide-GDP ribazoletransferase n=1 Tax=Rhodovulum strictum TaxID=58314 RepID=A0A844BAI2_9RHOB|nr:adenosylcobinamide-GDP ribazoletransferase [Rhodovulum strictum]MRH21424.1 adenosylcobinamide-GDP ribazoletransferase [Rhodovulum strictum]